MHSVIKRVESFFKDIDNRHVTKVFNRLRRTALPYHYVNMSKITEDTINWCKTLTSDFDTVVAIPRSGMIPGSIIATTFGKSLSTPDMIINGDKWITKQSKKHNSNCNNYGTILLVDDFVYTGEQLLEVKKKIKLMLPRTSVISAALYVDESKKDLVDLYYKVVDHTLHQWDYNLMHAYPGKIAYDLDGVLCHNWDNMSCYETFIRTARPYRIPLYEIDLIVTARYEWHREATVKWLKDHNVKYKKLYMRQNQKEDVIKFKSDVFIKEKPLVYVESEPYYAKKIHERTGATVLCTGDNCLYD